MKKLLFLFGFFLLLCGPSMTALAETMPAPVTPPPPPVTPPVTPGGGGGISPPPGGYYPGSAYGSSTADHEFRGVFETSVKLTQPLWEGGATAAQVAIQRARLGTALFLLEDAASSLAFDAIASHVDVLRRREMVQLAEENVRNHQRMLAALKSRVSDGLTTVGDVHQVQSRLSRAQGSLAEYTSYLQATEASFLRITGKRAPQHMVAVPAPTKAYTSSAQASLACQERNPRIKAAAAEISAYEGEKKYAASRDYPHFNAEVGPRWYFQDTERDSTNHGFDALLVMRWNLYEGGATASAKQAASAKQRQARQVLHRTMDVFAEDIQATWARYMSAQQQATFYAQGMKSAKAARTAFYEQYMLGTRNLLDVLDAENDYFMSASQHLVARGDRTIAAWRLLAIGGDILGTLQVDVTSLRQVESTPISTDNNLTIAASSWNMREEKDLRVKPVSSPAPSMAPHNASAALKKTPGHAPDKSPLQVLAAYARREGNKVHCKLSLRSRDGTPQMGSIRVILLAPEGEQLLETDNAAFALQRGLEKRLTATLPEGSTINLVRLEAITQQGDTLFSTIREIN